MGQKINPISLRLQSTNRHFDSCWYSNYFYRDLITRDIFLQHYLNNFLKLLKLPTGRYSIQHLQKKTQIYNFLCYSKSTREWRSKIFGLIKKKNSLKKARYFFKNNAQLRKKFKKQTKLSSFYKTLNQIAIHKVKKKITSFQNFQLWSTLINPKHKTSFHLNLRLGNHFSPFSVFSMHKLRLNTVSNSNVNSQLNDTFLIVSKSLEKINVLPQKSLTVSRDLENHYTTESSMLTSTRPLDNSNLLFLQNLVVYKIVKSQLKNNLGKKKIISKGTTQPLIKFKDSLSPSFDALNFKYNKYLESSLASLYKIEFNLTPFKVKNDWQNASYLADEIVYFLEKRISFRALKSKILKQLSKISTIRGVRITCSGRVGGKSKKAQRAKTECIKYGQTSLQVFSSKIDFSVKTAFTSFGSVGVKVWICYV